MVDEKQEKKPSTPLKRQFSQLLWFVTFALAGLAAVDYVLTHANAPNISAPQEAALAAGTLVAAVVPYCFARAWDELTRV